MAPARMLYALVIFSMLFANMGFLPAASPSQAPLAPAAQPAWQALTVQPASGLDLGALGRGETFTLVFSEAMDPGSANPALMAYPYLPGQLRWSADHKQLSFSPQGGFEVRGYTLFLDRNLKSAAGRSFEHTQQWQVQVIPGPKVVSHEPLDDGFKNLKPNIRVIFDREMDAASIREGLKVEPALQYNLEVKGKVATLALSEAMSPGVTYRFEVGAPAHDLKGAPLDPVYRWAYNPAPLHVEAELSKEKEIRLYFNYPVEVRKTGTPFAIDPALEGGWTWDNLGAIFHSERAIDRGTRYTISFTQPFYGLLNSTLGTLDPLVFTPAPPIESALPVDEWVQLDLDAISIQFQIAMDAASVEKAFSVEPALKGHVEWKEKLFSYVLEERLKRDTLYKVTLQAGVLDAQGKTAMLDPYHWEFRSDTYDFSGLEVGVNFGCEGPNVQVVDASGKRSILFSRGDSSPSPVDFALYPLPLNEFAQVYRQYYRDRGYYYQINEADQIPTQGLKRQSSWRVQPGGRVQEAPLPADTPPGLYILSASLDGKLQDQIMVALTRNTLTVKKSGTRLWVWVSDINGESLPDMEVRLYTQDGQQMRQGKTDAEGVFETSLPKDSPPMLVAARGPGDDVAISGIGVNWRTNPEDYNTFWSMPYEAAERSDYQAYVYTERPIYRPGDTVNFKVILRQDDDARYTTPESGTPVNIRVLDPRGNELQSYTLRTNEFGTVNTSFQVGQSAGLGEYRIEVSPGTKADAGVFKVEDYRKPDYQVTVTAPQDTYIDGDSIEIEVDTRYFFGKPVAHARLTVMKYRLEAPWWRSDIEATGGSPHYTWYAYGSSSSYSADAQGHFVYQDQAETVESEYWEPGCLSSWNSSLKRCTWAIEVTAEDGSGQSVSGSIIYYVYNSAEKITLNAGEWLKKPGQPFTVQAEVTRMEDGQPVAERELVLEVLYWQSWEQVVLSRYTLATGKDGVAQQEIQVDKPGSYQLRVSPASYFVFKGAIVANDWFYVYAPQDDWAQSMAENAWGTFRISAEQSRYKPYQKARLAIESDFSGPAMLTFERGQVIHSLPVMLTAPLTVVDTEIIPEYAPNVFVVVNAWKAEPGKLDNLSDSFWGSQSNSRLKLAEVELQVEASEKVLNIAITPGQETYAPREEAVFDIQINDSQNRPVEAEFSLALVDEAIFALSGEMSQPIFQAFYGRKDHEVVTYNSLEVLRVLGFCGGGRGGGGGGPSMGNPRANFPDTAAWFPALVTDKNGKATVRVTLPDNLTTWRVVVKAVTKNTRVGEGMARVVTQQAAVLQPLLPRILTSGDELEISALLHNYSSQSREFTLSLNAGGLEIKEGQGQKVTLQANEVQVVSWWAKALQAGLTEVTLEARPASGAGDAIRLPLEIRPASIPELYTQAGDFVGTFETILSAPAGFQDLSEVEIRLSRSIAGNLLDGLAYLTGYPYGCVEQTMSRALPNAVVGRAFTGLGVYNPQQARLDSMIRDGLQRLYGMQHEDGGWGWWHDDDSTPYQTAWVVYGLSLTAQAGYPVDPDVIERGVQYLNRALKPEMGAEDMDPRLKTYVLYSLAAAGQGDRAETLAMVENARDLDAFSQAALALALQALEEPDAARGILDLLEASVVRSDAQAWWETGVSDGEYHAKTMSSATRSTALALSAFVKIDPQSEMIPEIVRYLMGQRRALGWGTTNETAYTVMALTDHLLALQESEGEAGYQVILNGETVGEGSLARGTPTVVIHILARDLLEGLNDLKLTQEGDQRLFYTINSRMVFDQPEIKAAGPVVVKRSYVHPETGQPVKTLKPGQVVRVKLEVIFPTPYASYILVEDYLPGGLEAVNERLNTASHYGGTEYNEYADIYYRFFWQEYGYNQKEIYADRVSFFVTEINRWDENRSGTLHLDYLARVTHAGQFTALPAQVSAMYDETLWGRSASAPIEISQ